MGFFVFGANPTFGGYGSMDNISKRLWVFVSNEPLTGGTPPQRQTLPGWQNRAANSRAKM
jgi:hypothetical protein